MSYDLSEHRHRFAVWAAARAAQRGFTTVGNLRAALESTDIRKSLALPETFQSSVAQFDKLHAGWCSAIQAFLNDRSIPNATYGRAAKLVAVYLKATVVLGDACNTPVVTMRSNYPLHLTAGVGRGVESRGLCARRR